jgi:hypothetical protein
MPHIIQGKRDELHRCSRSQVRRSLWKLGQISVLQSGRFFTHLVSLPSLQGPKGCSAMQGVQWPQGHSPSRTQKAVQSTRYCSGSPCNPSPRQPCSTGLPCMEMTPCYWNSRWTYNTFSGVGKRYNDKISLGRSAWCVYAFAKSTTYFQKNRTYGKWYFPTFPILSSCRTESSRKMSSWCNTENMS